MLEQQWKIEKDTEGNKEPERDQKKMAGYKERKKHNAIGKSFVKGDKSPECTGLRTDKELKRTATTMHYYRICQKYASLTSPRQADMAPIDFSLIWICLTKVHSESRERKDTGSKRWMRKTQGLYL